MRCWRPSRLKGEGWLFCDHRNGLALFGVWWQPMEESLFELQPIECG
jgi:hypothetical protein